MIPGTNTHLPTLLSGYVGMEPHPLEQPQSSPQEGLEGNGTAEIKEKTATNS